MTGSDTLPLLSRHYWRRFGPGSGGVDFKHLDHPPSTLLFLHAHSHGRSRGDRDVSGGFENGHMEEGIARPSSVTKPNFLSSSNQLTRPVSILCYALLFTVIVLFFDAHTQPPSADRGMVSAS